MFFSTILALAGCTPAGSWSLSDSSGIDWTETVSFLDGEMSGDMPDNGLFERELSRGYLSTRDDETRVGLDLFSEEVRWVQLQGILDLADVPSELREIDPDAYELVATSGPRWAEHPTGDIEYVDGYVGVARWAEASRTPVEWGGIDAVRLDVVVGFDERDPLLDVIVEDRYVVRSTIVFPAP